MEGRRQKAEVRSQKSDVSRLRPAAAEPTAKAFASGAARRGSPELNHQGPTLMPFWFSLRIAHERVQYTISV
jgi:hypothetical protein